MEANMKLNHLNLTVTDVPEAEKFLEKYFGLRKQTRPNSYACVRRDDIINKTLVRPLCGRFALVI
jgi:catechol 2,3-dioxygenase-like lactoylglutathione lyase family enzyme